MQGIASRQGTVKCPRCQSVTSLPAESVCLDGLPDYFGSDVQQPSGGTDGTDNLDAKHFATNAWREAKKKQRFIARSVRRRFVKLHERAHLQSRRTAKHDVERLSGRQHESKRRSERPAIADVSAAHFLQTH